MKEKAKQSAPLMRTEGLVAQALADEILVYDSRRHKAHCLNRTAASLWKRCDGKTTIAQMCELMTEEFGAPVTEPVARIGLAQLRRARLLEEPIAQARSPIAGISRREVIRRVGAAAAVALPMVTSIIAPKAAQAANCRANGDTCNGNGNCCSHSCVGGICV